MSTRKPVVGVVGHGYVVPKPFGDLPVTGTPPAFVESIVAAGGRPLILPPRQAPDLLDLVDALVLTGGGDVDPARYGGTGPAEDVDRQRDEDEIALVHAAAAAHLPLLGICRGMQILAVAFGGTLLGGLDHRIPDGGHDVRTAPGSLVARLLGPTARTSALHQQAVHDPGPHWRVTAWSHDGITEAIEPAVPGCPVLGVQWHPELAVHPVLDDRTGPALFGWLVEQAAGVRLDAFA
ncbi:MAG: gamma-glutamyl-gamma-aminobutyrate hydrolase family protein [Marmoricola sp.]